MRFEGSGPKAPSWPVRSAPRFTSNCSRSAHESKSPHARCGCRSRSPIRMPTPLYRSWRTCGVRLCGIPPDRLGLKITPIAERGVTTEADACPGCEKKSQTQDPGQGKSPLYTVSFVNSAANPVDRRGARRNHPAHLQKYPSLANR